MQFTLESQSDDGQAVFELVKGGRRFRCRIDLATGQAALSISGPERNNSIPRPPRPSAAAAASIRFANADDQLLLWIDSSVVAFDSPTTYDPRPGDRFPTVADLRPAGIASRGAALKISHLKLLRNIYYIAASGSSRIGTSATLPTSIFPDLADPSTWERFRNGGTCEFSAGRGPVLRLGRQQRPEQRRPPGDSQYWVDRELADRQGAVHLLAPFLGRVTIAGTDIPFPYFPNFRDGVCEVRDALSESVACRFARRRLAVSQ